MNKQPYIQPQLTIVDFKVENGLVDTGYSGLQNHESFLERLFQDNSYTTGETYTTFTDDQGQYATGTW